MFKLMLVEDEPIIREGLKHYFDWGALHFTSIVEAENGKEGLELALLEQPDLIITDIRMPIMSGLDMIEQLRPKLPDSLFVIISGHSDFQYAQRAIQLGGITEYLIKPLQYESSLATIEKCISQFMTKRQQSMDTQSKEQPHGLMEQSCDENHTINAMDEDQLFRSIEQFIVSHIDHDITLQMVADRFYYNPSYLSRLFKQKLNKNYSRFQAEIRIKFAQQCLTKPENLVSDVCKMCGYHSYKHFVKTFKLITGMTPSEYRKRLGLA